MEARSIQILQRHYRFYGRALRSRIYSQLAAQFTYTLSHTRYSQSRSQRLVIARTESFPTVLDGQQCLAILNAQSNSRQVTPRVTVYVRQALLKDPKQRQFQRCRVPFTVCRHLQLNFDSTAFHESIHYQGIADTSPISSSSGGCRRWDIVRTSSVQRSRSSSESFSALLRSRSRDFFSAIAEDILIATRYCPMLSCNSRASRRRSSSCVFITRADSCCSSEFARSSCWRRSSERWAEVTMPCTWGINPGSATAVTTDATAVTSFTSPANQ